MLCTQESLVRMNPSIHAFDGREGLLKDSEVIIPVISKGELLGVMLPGRRADGSHYSHTEFDIFQNISLVLGPLIENAMLLEGLEEKVNLRTRELNRALAESVRKGQELRENSDIIGRQNKIFRTLLETSTRIHHLDNVDDLFSFILSQLHTLFSDFRGGIILENRRRGILEAMSFLGISEAEQKVILELREEIMTPEFGDTLNHALFTREIPASASDVWTVFPMEGRESGMIGYLIFKGQELDRLTKEIFAVFLGQLSAVTQNKLLMIQLERMASTDGLTGLYNRAFLNQELKKVIDHARRYKNMHFSIMIVDVNGLKRINDTYGHEKGDEAIVRAGRLLRSVCRQTDVVARLGGDEFAILMPSTSLSQAEILYGRIYQAASTLKIFVSRPGEQPAAIPVRMSVGLACSDDTPPDMVMKKADALMYNVKKQYYASMKTARG
jgi:diguanylate cyclase (GGDEF)-like protein